MIGEEFVAHRFFAQEEVVDDEEEVFPRSHNHPAALLQHLAAPLAPTHALSRLHPDPTLEQQQEIDRWSPAALRPPREAFYKKATARLSKRGLYTI